MSKIFTFVLLFWIIVSLSGCGFSQSAPQGGGGMAGEPNSPKAEKAQYPMEEVAKHSTREDCWTVFEGKVFDISELVPKHPAGAEKAAKACGQDISGTFLKNPMHQSKGKMNLEEKYIGNLR